jgi:uncharacterized membrane protein YdfJ with MMPL/SSD domain
MTQTRRILEGRRVPLLPALVTLFGRWNWWLPALPARLLAVEASPATARRRTGLRPRATLTSTKGRS